MQKVQILILVLVLIGLLGTKPNTLERYLATVSSTSSSTSIVV